MSFVSENMIEEIQNCYNLSKCLSKNKNGFLSKKIQKITKILKPLLKKILSNSCKSQCWNANNENDINEGKLYEEQNSLNEYKEEEYNNIINEQIERQYEQQQKQQVEDIQVVVVTSEGTYTIPYSMLPWCADYDICLRNDVYTITRDQIPQVQVPTKY